MRFNRYIVECKDTFGAAGTDAKTDLIDTLWNVKAIPSTTSPYLRCDLIDTLWNVKVLQPVSHCQNSSI